VRPATVNGTGRAPCSVGAAKPREGLALHRYRRAASERRWTARDATVLNDPTGAKVDDSRREF
jgi:hypothetical protein